MAGHLTEEPDLTMLPVEERRAVQRALAKNPVARWPSCQAFIEELERNLRPLSLGSPAAESSSGWDEGTAPTRGRFRPPNLTTLGIAALVLVVAVLGVALWLSATDLDPVAEVRLKEIEREVASLRAHEPILIQRPPANYQEVDRLDPPNNSGFDILTDERVLDLRLWREVPPDKMHELFSGVNHVRRLRMKKVAAVDEVQFESRTSGYDIFASCPGQFPFRVMGQRGETFVGTDRMKVRKLLIDVSNVPENSEFDLRTTYTYWNSLQTEQELWFGIMGYERSFKASLLLLFPDSKPYRDYNLMVAKTIKDKPVNYSGPKILLEGPTNDWVYWEVPNPEAGHVYRFHWKW
jgi:hypothetical protein